MPRRIKSAVLVLIALLFTAGGLQAAFYKYVDKAGNVYFVDEIWKIPAEYRDQVGRYTEKFDHLTQEQKTKAIAAEQERRELLEAERRRQTEIQLKEMRELEEAETKRSAEIERQNLLKATETPVTITRNTVLVPVTFTNAGVEVAARLVMDTGASHTTIHRSIADQLNIITLYKTQSRVAGGGVVHTELGKVDSMQVGPIEARGMTVCIIFVEGPAPSYDGLLGMDFLSQVEYSIDYENQVVRWKPRQKEVAR
jgi:predicted aspartyl protease